MSDLDEPGSGFWWKVIGGVVLIGIVGFILLSLFVRAAYAWGFGGVVVGGIIVLVAFAWFYDRRNARHRAQLRASEAPLTAGEAGGAAALSSGEVPLRAPDDDLGDHRIGA